MMIAARYRAKLLGLPFTLVEADIIIPDFCPVLGMALEFGIRNADYSPSMDRVIPSLGYVPSNIRIISRRANAIKRNATLEEVRRVYEYMREVCQN